MVERADERGAHRAGPLTFGTVHPEVGEQRIVLPEQIRETPFGALLVEDAIVASSAIGRRVAAEGGDALNVAPQVDLLGERLLTRGTVLGGVSGERLVALGGELCRRYQVHLDSLSSAPHHAGTAS